MTISLMSADLSAKSHRVVLMQSTQLTQRICFGLLPAARATKVTALAFSLQSAIPRPIGWLDEFESREETLQAAYRSALADAARAERPPPSAPQLDVDPLFPPAVDERELALTPVGYELIRWLVRHLGTEGLVERVLAKLAQGRCLHAQLRQGIRQQLDSNHGLLDGYVRFWRIVAAEGKWLSRGRMRIQGPAWVVRESLGHNVDEGWLRQELLAALRPLLELSPSFYRRFREAIDTTGSQEPIGDSLSHIAYGEVVLADGDHVPAMIEAVNARPNANVFWAEQLDDLTGLLAQALHLYRAVDQASGVSDPSLVQRPSIMPHQQNRAHSQWTLLFDLIWQGWTHLDATDRTRSRAAVQRWRGISYLAFRRLVLAAMNISPHFSAEERMEALLNG